MAYLEHLASSGLTEQDGKRMGWRDLSAGLVLDKVGFSEAGLFIPYYGIDGKRLRFQNQEVCRVRFYHPTNKHAFQPGRPKAI